MVKLITENMDIWTAAQIPKANSGRGRGNNSNGQSIHGMKKLRELILELAVRGKLVPQDPKDESASVLLDKIAIEKAQFIKEGKIKKQKPLPEIGEGEKPFELPEGWEWTRIGNVGNIFNGNSVNARLKEEKYTNIGGGLPFIATKDVGYGWKELDYDNGVSIPKDEPKFKVAHKGAVLICSEGGSAGKKCGITNRNICFGNKLYAIELYVNIESNYILANYLSPMFFHQFRDKMTGIIGGISAAKFSELIVPVPPLAEQYRIVTKVGELMALCDLLEQQQADNIETYQVLVETLLATLSQSDDQRGFSEAWQRIADHFDILFATESSIDQLKKTILQLAVMGKLVPQDPNDEPASVLLEKIAKEKERLIKEGKIKKQKPFSGIGDDQKMSELPIGWSFSRLGDLINLVSGQHLKPHEYTDTKENGMIPYLTGPAEFGDQSPTPTRFTNERRALALNGDILLTCKGSGVGKLNVADSEIAISRQLMSIQPILANQKYVKLLVMSLKEILRGKIVGIAIPGISREDVIEAIVKLPPLPGQHRIVAKVDELMALCDDLKNRLKEAQIIQVQLADAIVEQAVA